ncbi:MAG: glycosyltransferase family 39 protein [Planctomyces sp.]
MARDERNVQSQLTDSAARRSVQSDPAGDSIGRLLLVLACLSSIGLMFPMWSAGPLVLDEHGSYWMIDSDLPGTTLSRSLSYTAIPPLSGWLQELFLLALGKSELVFRLPSALCHLIAVPVIYFAGTTLRGRLPGGIAALLLAWHPEALDEVRIARCYGLVLLMASLVVWATLRWLKHGPQVRWVVAWTLSAAGLMWTHYTSALLVILAAGCLGFSSFRARKPGTGLTPWLLAMMALTLLCMPLIPSVLRLREWGPYLNYMSADQSIWSFIGPVWWLGIPMGLLTSRTLCRKRSADQSSEMKMEGSWLLVLAMCSLFPLLILAVLASGDLSSLANPRYRVAYAPAGACLIAAMMSTKSHRTGVVLGAIVTIVSSWAMSPLLPWQLGRLGSPTDAEWRDANLFLAANSKAGEQIFVQSGLAESSLVPAFPTDDVFLEYVACRVSRFYLESLHPRVGLPFRWDVSHDVPLNFRSRMLSGSGTETSFWVAAATDTDLNRASLAGLQQIARSSGFALQNEKTWPNVRVERYVLPASEAP